MSKDETASKLEKSKSEVEFERAKYWVPRIAIGIFIVIIILYFSRYIGNPMGSNSDLGAFGDFVGGVLNPLLTFGTILLLIYSITFQLDELKETRNEIKDSREEIKKSNEISTSNVEIQKTIFETERIIGELDNGKSLLINIEEALIFKFDEKGIKKTISFSEAIRERKTLERIIGNEALELRLQVSISQAAATIKALSFAVHYIYINKINLSLVHLKLIESAMLINELASELRSIMPAFESSKDLYKQVEKVIKNEGDFNKVLTDAYSALNTNPD